MTGNPRYLDAAVKMADVLARRVKPGDSENSPWPFRVQAASGQTVRSRVVIEYFEAPAGQVDMKRTHQIAASYTTNWTGALRLFDGLLSLQKGDAAAYQRARDILSAWIKAYPLKNYKWGPFFEDVPAGMWSDTEINADTMAWYILENPGWDPEWRETARRILDWSYATFSNREWEDVGAIVINEQTVYKQPGNSHTSRHASVDLLYAEKTGDPSGQEAAIRRLNWTTYMVDDDGKNVYPATRRANAGNPRSGGENWLTDGYGDYVRHYLRAMASLPELAPENQTTFCGRHRCFVTSATVPARSGTKSTTPPAASGSSSASGRLEPSAAVRCNGTRRPRCSACNRRRSPSPSVRSNRSIAPPVRERMVCGESEGAFTSCQQSSENVVF